MALSYQEVAITLLDGTRDNFRRVSRFAAGTRNIVSTVGLLVIAFTPLAGIWFRQVSGLSDALAVVVDTAVAGSSVSSHFFRFCWRFSARSSCFGRTTRPITDGYLRGSRGDRQRYCSLTIQRFRPRRGRRCRDRALRWTPVGKHLHDVSCLPGSEGSWDLPSVRRLHGVGSPAILDERSIS